MTTSIARILVTDDDPLALKAAEHLLSSVGYEVFTASNGEETLRLAEIHPLDLILLDVILPDIEGTEVCRRIKADPLTAGIFIVLLSGIRTGSDEQAQGMEGGADGYIARPITNRELLARIQAYLRIKTAEQALKKYSEHLEDVVSERTRELRDMQEHLLRQEKLAVLGQMAGSVGHELRNPLAVISNAVYLLKQILPEANEKVKEYLSIIQNETRTSDKIITDLLNFARVISVERESFSVPKLVQRTLERFPPPDSVLVSLDFPKDLPNAFADPSQVEQVLGNLVLNACQAMATGGKLTISAQKEKEMLAIAVQDTGAGISPENMGKLFEPLFTTKTKGIGLGLAVSQKLADANSGRIEVESQPGQGSTFTVYLPVK